MKNYIISSIISMLFFGCSSDGNNDANSNNSNSILYGVQRVLGQKVHAEASVVATNNYTIKMHSYTNDTLEIDLNGVYSDSYSITIETEEFESPSVNAPDNITSHVNYINFINLQPNWNDNGNTSIQLLDNGNNVFHDFTYSESNIELTNYPELWIKNRFIPTYATLQKKPKIGHVIEYFDSTFNYEVGEVIIRNGIKYKVVSIN